MPLDFQPGTLWRYSGQAGFDVLSRIVEVVSGQTFDVFLKQRMFDPLGMKDTAFVLTPDRVPRLALQYQRGENWPAAQLRRISRPRRRISQAPVA